MWLTYTYLTNKITDKGVEEVKKKEKERKEKKEKRTNHGKGVLEMWRHSAQEPVYNL